LALRLSDNSSGTTRFISSARTVPAPTMHRLRNVCCIKLDPHCRLSGSPCREETLPSSVLTVIDDDVETALPRLRQTVRSRGTWSLRRRPARSLRKERIWAGPCPPDFTLGVGYFVREAKSRTPLDHYHVAGVLVCPGGSVTSIHARPPPVLFSAWISAGHITDGPLFPYLVVRYQVCALKPPKSPVLSRAARHSRQRQS